MGVNKGIGEFVKHQNLLNIKNILLNVERYLQPNTKTEKFWRVFITVSDKEIEIQM